MIVPRVGVGIITGIVTKYDDVNSEVLVLSVTENESFHSDSGVMSENKTYNFPTVENFLNRSVIRLSPMIIGPMLSYIKQLMHLGLSDDALCAYLPPASETVKLVDFYLHIMSGKSIDTYNNWGKLEPKDFMRLWVYLFIVFKDVDIHIEAPPKTLLSSDRRHEYEIDYDETLPLIVEVNIV